MNFVPNAFSVFPTLYPAHFTAGHDVLPTLFVLLLRLIPRQGATIYAARMPLLCLRVFFFCESYKSKSYL